MTVQQDTQNTERDESTYNQQLPVPSIAADVISNHEQDSRFQNYRYDNIPF
jgi:hypothetical protein